MLFSRRHSLRIQLLFGGLFLLGLVGGGVLADWLRTIPAGTKATFVGRGKCLECHQPQGEAFHGSHHQLAMDRATPETVLGDFNDATLEHDGIRSRMFRRDEKYWVETEGPDGKLGEFEVKYVFGVHPLQQYMVELERPDERHPDCRDPACRETALGRTQVLRVSWDAVEKKWFYLKAPDVEEKLAHWDPLHWTGPLQNWNHTCADCHSTDVHKQFDVATRTYATVFSEVDVSCETCHGPGSLHVELAERTSLFWDRKRGYALADLKSADTKVEIQTCAACHSRRRAKVQPDFKGGDDYYDYFMNDLIRPELYYCDGQQLDEVYEYGSFLQSKMYHNNVRCTDCHDPHTARLKHEGNNVCTSCHQHPAGKYDTPAHHRHEPGSAGAQCVDCHMPARAYMEIDWRRDHSFKIPNPELSLRHGVPNACVQCHLRDGLKDETLRAANRVSEEERVRGPGRKTPAENASGEEPPAIAPLVALHEKFPEYANWLRAAALGDAAAKAELDRLNRWALDACRKWYGWEENRPHYANVFADAWKGEPVAMQALIDLARDRQLPAIIRASAVLQLERYSERDRAALDALHKALGDPDPSVRHTALSALDSVVAFLAGNLREAEAEMAQMERILPQAAGHDANVVQDILATWQQRQGQALEARQRVRQTIQPIVPLMKDARYTVRTEAACVLASVPADMLRDEELKRRNALLAEYIQGILNDNDQAGAHLRAGILYERLGDFGGAEESYRRGIAAQPNVYGPRTNLANLLVLQGHDSKAKQFQMEELELLKRTIDLLPESDEAHWRYGSMLHLLGRSEEAVESWKRAAELNERNVDSPLLLMLYYEREENYQEALRWALDLVRRDPDNLAYHQFARKQEWALLQQKKNERREQP